MQIYDANYTEIVLSISSVTNLSTEGELEQDVVEETPSQCARTPKPAPAPAPAGEKKKDDVMAMVRERVAQREKKRQEALLAKQRAAAQNKLTPF